MTSRKRTIIELCVLALIGAVVAAWHLDFDGIVIADHLVDFDVRGRVIDAVDGRPIAGAEVILFSDRKNFIERATCTSDLGEFRWSGHSCTTFPTLMVRSYSFNAWQGRIKLKEMPVVFSVHKEGYLSFQGHVRIDPRDYPTGSAHVDCGTIELRPESSRVERVCEFHHF